MGMFKSHIGQPFNATVTIVGALFPARQVWKVSSPGGAGAYKYRIIFLLQDLFEAFDIVVEVGVNAQIQYIIDFLIQYFFRKTEGGDLAAHHPAAGDL